MERQPLSNRDQALSNKINKFWGTLCTMVISYDHKQINKFSVMKDYPNHIHTTLRWGRAPGKPSRAGAFWAQTEDPSGCGAASPSQGRWDPESLRPALSLGGQATAGERSPGRSLCLTKSSACGRLWQFAHPRPLSLLQRGLAPRSKGKARAELRPARRQARLPHSRSLLLPGREG